MVDPLPSVNPLTPYPPSNCVDIFPKASNGYPVPAIRTAGSVEEPARRLRPPDTATVPEEALMLSSTGDEKHR